MNQIKIISHKEKSEWVLESKYNIGRKKIWRVSKISKKIS
jgi:hypothetical protein